MENQIKSLLFNRHAYFAFLPILFFGLKQKKIEKSKLQKEKKLDVCSFPKYNLKTCPETPGILIRCVCMCVLGGGWGLNHLFGQGRGMGQRYILPTYYDL